LKAPYWYWIVLGVVALAGVVLIVYSTTHQVDVVGVTTEGDYFMGNPDAQVTIIDWGNFG
jgi:hypothetical protein